MSSDNILGKEFFEANRARLRQLFTGTAPIVLTGNYLIQKSADIAYDFEQDTNFWYLTGCDEPGFILVMDGDKEYFIAPEESKNRDVFDGEVDYGYILANSGIETVYNYEDGWKHLSKKISKVKHVATISPPADYIPSMLMFTAPARAKLIEKIKSYNDELDFIDLKQYFVSLRSIKSNIELQQIKDSVELTAKLYKNIQKCWQNAENESDIIAEATKYAHKNQAKFAYDPIIAGGLNAVTLHYTKNNCVLNSDEILLVDGAISCSKYSADITRSAAKNPSKRQIAVYEAVLNVQQFAINLLKPGLILKDYEQKVHGFMGEKLRELGLIKTISDETVREFYPHSTSHFLGLDVHDIGDYDASLAPGMVLTVEPGIYIKQEKIGIRIEDNIVITDNGYENLSESIIKDPTRFA